MTFQQLLETRFGPKYAPYIFGYLDDIIVVTETFEEHLEELEFIINVLGLDSCPGRPETRPGEDEAHRKFRRPKNRHTAQAFFGDCGARCVDKYVEEKIPLPKLLRKRKKFEWGEEQQ